MPFNLKVGSVREGEAIDKKYTCDGADISPEINWENPTGAVKSFALIMDDPDAPIGTFVHWVIYNIRPGVRQLPEDIERSAITPQGWMQGINGFGKNGYNGPCPPGKKEHRYYFKLYALKCDPNLPQGLKKKGLEKQIDGEILDQAVFMARYGRT